MAAVIGALRAELSASIAKFAEDMGKAGNSVSKFQRRFASAGKSMQRTGLIMTAAVTAPIVALAKQSLDAYTRQEQAIAGVEAALKSMGPVAGFTSRQLQDMAANLQKVTTFGDEDILSKVTANLLTFGQVQGDVFRRAQAVTLDLSARLGQDLQSSAIMVGKALNDPVRGLTALSRVGVAFSDEQRGVIKALAETGDVAGAQAIMLRELERQYGGQAAALAKTTGGQLTQLNNAWGDFQEVIGQVVAQILPPLIELMRDLVSWLQTLDPETIKWGVAIAGIAAAAGPVILVLGTLATAIAALMPVLTAVGGAVLAVVSGPIGWLVAAAALVITAFDGWGAIADAARRVYEGIKTWLMDRLGPVIDWLAGAADEIKSFFGILPASAAESVRATGVVARGMKDALAPPVRAATEAAGASFDELAARIKAQKLFEGLAPQIQALRDRLDPIAAAMRDYASAMKLAELAGLDLARAQAVLGDEALAAAGGLDAVEGRIESLPKVLYEAAERMRGVRLLEEQAREADRLAARIASLGESLTMEFDPGAARDARLGDIEAAWKAGAISAQVYEAAVKDAWDTFDNASRGHDETFQRIDLALDRLGQTMTDLIFRTGDWKDAVRALLQQLAQILFIAPFLEQLKASLSGFGSSGGFVSSIGSFFAGFFADGGVIPRGQFGVVGENGPEIVHAGHGDMTVAPAGMGGGVTQVFNISTPDANSFRASERQIARMARQRLGIA